MTLPTLTERQQRRLLALIRAELEHTQSLRMMTSRAHVGTHGTLADIAEDLADIAELLNKGGQ